MKPILINNLELTRNGGTQAGTLGFDALGRLSDLIDKGRREQLEVAYELVGGAEKFHLPHLALKLDAVLPMICQRCLAPMTVDMHLTFDYVVSDAEPDAFDDDDDVDWVEASTKMDLNALIEDELLIAAPLSPRHSTACDAAKMESGEKHNPFSALKGLLK